LRPGDTFGLAKRVFQVGRPRRPGPDRGSVNGISSRRCATKHRPPGDETIFPLPERRPETWAPYRRFQVIKQWGSIMYAFLTMLYRLYVVTRLLEIRRHRIAA
jgi:hypothetical protein